MDLAVLDLRTFNFAFTPHRSILLSYQYFDNKSFGLHTQKFYLHSIVYFTYLTLLHRPICVHTHYVRRCKHTPLKPLTCISLHDLNIPEGSSEPPDPLSYVYD